MGGPGWTTCTLYVCNDTSFVAAIVTQSSSLGETRCRQQNGGVTSVSVCGAVCVCAVRSNVCTLTRVHTSTHTWRDAEQWAVHWGQNSEQEVAIACVEHLGSTLLLEEQLQSFCSSVSPSQENADIATLFFFLFPLWGAEIILAKNHLLALVKEYEWIRTFCTQLAGVKETSVDLNSVSNPWSPRGGCGSPHALKLQLTRTCGCRFCTAWLSPRTGQTDGVHLWQCQQVKQTGLSTLHCHVSLWLSHPVCSSQNKFVLFDRSSGWFEPFASGKDIRRLQRHKEGL